MSNFSACRCRDGNIWYGEGAVDLVFDGVLERTREAGIMEDQDQVWQGKDVADSRETGPEVGLRTVD